MSDEGAEEPAIKSARRVYDRQLDMLANIDDVSMRTFRTNVLVFGIIAAALSTGGPTAVASLHWLPLALAALGCVTLIMSAFVCIAVYNLTEYPLEVGPDELTNAPDQSVEQWRADHLDRLETVVPQTEAEVQQNSEYLANAQVLMVAGLVALAYGAAWTLGNQAFGLPMGLVSILHVIAVVLGVAALGAGKVLSSSIVKSEV